MADVLEIPAEALERVRRTYDTRSKVLDWMLALAVVSTLVFIFWYQLDSDGETADTAQANQSAASVWPANQNVTQRVYTYNEPNTRQQNAGRIGSGNAVPFNPAGIPWFPAAIEAESGD